MLFLLMGIFVGALLPIQTALNAQMRSFLKSPFLASLCSFTIGTIFLALLVLLSGDSLFLSKQQVSILPLWAYLGGLLGMLGLTANILLFPVLGSVQTVIMPILGQLLMSLLIDQFGWFHAKIHSFSLFRAFGTIGLIIGVLLVVFFPQYFRQEKQMKYVAPIKAKSNLQFLWQLVGIGAGMLMSSQVAINGYLGHQIGSSVHAAFISFFVGTILVCLAVCFERSWLNIRQVKFTNIPPWLWLAGMLGAGYVFCNAFLAPKIGTGAIVTLALVGQILSSMTIDQFGLLGAIQKKIKAIQLLGLAILFIGVLFIEIF
ncbi:DMT family transporter [Enterococcus columbae]|uniref:Integral membrane protein n=1 Tax=Enterococcus columbae DSM 7374 = ATCC 51263 TaxID=1121865 RepID=S1N6J2_9ENTE|nr:DMT family transporter [Enterococcus columbae]EOT44474.1 hypothetical protein OMW_00530 [Enterococcus columbae DSM 7374 = ATCC 51263]EOW84632.1 hypothetical protein I568_01128 [Enterococcus columbae DSM 7374 = ATCC 51263]